MSLNERILSATEGQDEQRVDSVLRPSNFTEFIGQKKVINNVELMVASAVKRNTAIDHILLSGPPGLGKTSLAMLIAKHIGTELHIISAPAIEKKGDLAAILTSLQPRDVLFIDEIHRLNISTEEFLYTAMEDFRLDLIIGTGPASRTMRIDLVPFTLVGATTRAGLLSRPLRERFLAQLHFDYYSPEELALIVEANAKKIGLNFDEAAIINISHCARGTPRIANRILRRVRDFAVVSNTSKVTLNTVKQALELMEIDNAGLDKMDRKILSTIATQYQGGPVGVETLAATLSEDRGTIEEVYEPYLLKEGLLVRTPRGRLISQKGLDHLQIINS